jgi:putative transposase
LVSFPATRAESVTTTTHTSSDRPEGRRRRPGYFQLTRPDELWHLDMTSISVAEHGWCSLNAAIDCCTREIVG